MCKITNEIRFCTCSESTLKNIPWTWTIKRYRGVDWMSLETGRCSGFIFNKKDKNNIKVLSDALNFKDSFDFDYQPEEKDILNIRYNKNEKNTKFEFEYRDGLWEVCEQLTEHFDLQLIIHKGKIK